MNSILAEGSTKRGAGTAALAAAVLALGLLAGCAAPLPAPSAPVRDVAGDLVPENDEQAAVLAGKLDRTGACIRGRSWPRPCGPAGRMSLGASPVRSRWRTARCGGDVGRCGHKTLDRLEAPCPVSTPNPACWRSGSAG